MRLKILILLAAVLLCGSLSALDISAGGKIGPGPVFLYGDDADDYDPAGGLSLGIYGMFSPIKYFAVQAEFNYEFKGASGEMVIANGAITAEGRQHLHYLSVPLIAKGLFPVKIVTIQPYAGFNFSFLVDARIKGETNVLGTKTETDERNRDDLAVFDFGILFGAETFIHINKNIYVSADVRMNISFLALDEDRDVNMYNGAFYILLGAGYKF